MAGVATVPAAAVRRSTVSAADVRAAVARACSAVAAASARRVRSRAASAAASARSATARSPSGSRSGRTATACAQTGHSSPTTSFGRNAATRSARTLAARWARACSTCAAAASARAVAAASAAAAASTASSATRCAATASSSGATIAPGLLQRGPVGCGGEGACAHRRRRAPRRPARVPPDPARRRRPPAAPASARAPQERRPPGRRRAPRRACAHVARLRERGRRGLPCCAGLLDGGPGRRSVHPGGRFGLPGLRLPLAGPGQLRREPGPLGVVAPCRLQRTAGRSGGERLARHGVVELGGAERDPGRRRCGRRRVPTLGQRGRGRAARPAPVSTRALGGQPLDRRPRPRPARRRPRRAPARPRRPAPAQRGERGDPRRRRLLGLRRGVGVARRAAR